MTIQAKQRLAHLRLQLNRIKYEPLGDVIGELYPIVKEINDIKRGKYDEKGNY